MATFVSARADLQEPVVKSLVSSAEFSYIYISERLKGLNSQSTQNKLRTSPVFDIKTHVLTRRTSVIK